MKKALKLAAFLILVAAGIVAIGFCGYVLWILHGIGAAV